MLQPTSMVKTRKREKHDMNHFLIGLTSPYYLCIYTKQPMTVEYLQGAFYRRVGGLRFSPSAPPDFQLGHHDRSD